MPSVFSQMQRYAIGSSLFDDIYCRHKIRIGCQSSLPDGSDMININP
jgi:hypothetical protein